MASRKSAVLTPSEIPAGVIGLGLMGTSIIACLLASGHPVLAVTRNLKKHRNAKSGVRALLRQLRREGAWKGEPDAAVARFSITEDYADLHDRQIVIESIIENFNTKKEALRNVELAVPATTIIGTNTSAIPVTLLQKDSLHPERILGIHWAEPAHITRFMEIICGEKTRLAHAKRVAGLAEKWGKEPTLVRRDIRGFISNRIMYAMLREAFHLVESGYATVRDVDRSCRNDYGWWMTLAGPFRFMDLTGIPAYMAVMQDLFPELECGTRVPALMRKVVESGAKGIANSKGFYKYTPRSAQRWEKAFLRFSYDIRSVALKYPENVGD